VVTAQSDGLVGREAELERVVAFLERDGGRPSKLLLEGDPGIGKTTLWAAGLERAVERGFRVLRACPAAAERELSFAGLGDLLVDLRDEIGRLPAPQRRALRIALLLDEVEGDPPEQRAIAAALTELLRRLSLEQPVLVALDDAQWLDAPSGAALDFALRRVGDAPARVLATARVDAATQIGFADEERALIGSFTLDELDTLLRERLGTRFLRPVLRQIEEASGGNPFYALELAASLLRSGKQLAPGERLPIPTHLRGVVADRLDGLTPGAREATLATAALAQPTTGAVRAAIADGGAAIAEAVSAGVLQREGESLRFTHPLFAASVYEDTTADDRKAMHRRLASVVTDPEERARQLAEGAGGPDATISAFVEAAAASVVARGAPDAGVRLAKLAVELTPPGRMRVLHKRRLDCARYASAAGDPKHAKELLERQLDTARAGRERAEVELELARTEWVTRGASAATAHLERALREVDGSDELELLATVLTELADMHIADLRTDSDASERAVALAEQVWNPELLARALAVHGLTLLDRHEPPSDDYWKRALELERASGRLRWDGPACAYAVQLFVRGRFETASELMREAADSMRARGDSALPMALLYLSDIARAAGFWTEASDYADEAHDAAVQSGRDSAEPVCILYRARFALLRGELARAGDDVARALSALERLNLAVDAPAAYDGAMPQALANSLLGRIALMSERYADAHEWLGADVGALREMNARELLVEALADDTSALVALGDLETAARHVREMQELAWAMDPPYRALAARARGIVAAAKGELRPALQSLERSRRLLESGPWPWPFELGKTLVALGAVQRRAHQKAPARATLEHARDIFEQLGAALWAERARGELAQLGGRPSRRDALTATEARVAETVAAGRSNAEAARELFMSPKTVEWNLSKIYKKLHVRSRAELTAKLAGRATFTQP
jgi:DNA-binding CsgD family transcriptional regulator